jgi:hypothetical protein
MRLPRNLPSQLAGGRVDALQYEILHEVAATLSRMGRKLEDALRALEAFDAANGIASSPDPSAERKSLVAAAGEALWYFVVQREVCGLRDSETVIHVLAVPREVQLRMGFRPRPQR